MTRLYTYYSHVPDMNSADELRNLILWRQHHAALGFEPFVLNEWHARQHPYFEEFDQAVSKFPTINPKTYDRACFLRWLAMATLKGFNVMADYDCFLYSLDVPLQPLETGPLTVFQKYVPCLVSGWPEQFLAQCKRFAAYKPKEGENHISDQTILAAQAADDDAHKDRKPSFERLTIVKGYGEEGWEKAPAVHYSNSTMTPAGKQPRWQHIPKLR